MGAEFYSLVLYLESRIFYSLSLRRCNAKSYCSSLCDFASCRSFVKIDAYCYVAIACLWIDRNTTDIIKRLCFKLDVAQNTIPFGLCLVSITMGKFVNRNVVLFCVVNNYL